MKWKYLGFAVLAIILLLLLLPSYQYLSSIDWSRKHSNRIAALPQLQSSDHTGEFRLPIGELEFLVRVAGMQNNGAGIILLHGFPESSIMWEALLTRAATDGYRVVAFDQRGYSPGARPSKTSDYHISHLTNDVLAVADAVGFDTFHLVGHDWGAAVGWHAAMLHADRLKSWTSLTIPHIGVFFDAIVNHPEQKARSGYMKNLQRPFLPEYTFVSNDQAFFKQLMGGLPARHLNEYLALQAEHGAATATINWYRALDFSDNKIGASFQKQMTSPTLFIWGTEDGLIAPEIIPQQKAFLDGFYREVALQSGHALIQSKEDTVLTEVMAHIERNSD